MLYWHSDEVHQTHNLLQTTEHTSRHYIILFIGVGSSEKVGGCSIGGGMIQGNGRYFQMPLQRDKILLSGGGGEKANSAFSMQANRFTHLPLPMHQALTEFFYV